MHVQSDCFTDRWGDDASPSLLLHYACWLLPFYLPSFDHSDAEITSAWCARSIAREACCRAVTFQTARKDQRCHFRKNLLLVLWSSGSGLVGMKTGTTSSSTRKGTQRRTKHQTECRNRRKETVEPFSSRVANYWLGIPSKQYDDLVKKFAKAKGMLDGTIDLAWSAAFISYCMQMAGAGSAFPYSSGHATWMVLSIKNKRNGKLKASLVGFRPGEIPLKPGDLIARPRQDRGSLTTMRWRKAGS